MRAHGLQIAPFRALRYVPERIGSLAAVISPSYDLVTQPGRPPRPEAGNPYGIVRLVLPEAESRAEARRCAATTLRRWRAEGVVAEDPLPALYVYEQRGEEGAWLQRGLVGALRLSPPEEGVILPHEDVMPEAVAERAALMRATAAEVEPLLLSYRGGEAAADVAGTVERTACGAPLLEAVTRDGVTHRLWALTGSGKTAGIVRGLARHRAMISDGHHRWAACLRLCREHGGRAPWDRGLALLVDTDRYPLRVRAVHRLLPRLPSAEALARLGRAFRVRPVPGPLAAAMAGLERTAGTAFLLAGEGGFHLLDRPDAGLVERTVRTGRPELWRGLDTTVLHAVLLTDVWQVPDRPPDVGYLHDPRIAAERARQLGGTAVLLRPVPETAVRGLAEQGITLPGKSTSFGPKPASGLVMRSLGEPAAG